MKNSSAVAKWAKVLLGVLLMTGGAYLLAKSYQHSSFAGDLVPYPSGATVTPDLFAAGVGFSLLGLAVYVAGMKTGAFPDSATR